jgi:hypothetical protein
LLSLNPYSIALRRFAQNCFTSRRSADVKAKGIFAFSNAAGLVGASSQCFRSEGKHILHHWDHLLPVPAEISDKMKGAFVATMSVMRGIHFHHL